MDKVAIGSHLREARNTAKLTQKQLAEKVNVGATHLSDIERGAKFPSLSLLIKLANALGVSADFILRGEIEARKNCAYDDITIKLGELTPKQRFAVAELIDAYILMRTLDP